ncbi:MAG: NUDIX hydrolase [archaeon]|nr:MAG: NUDIX hydrolase [archaeon]
MDEKITAVGTLLEFNGKILIFKRRKELSQPETWGLPAGFIEPGETLKQAAIREVLEETGYKANLDNLEYLGEFIDIHLFRIKLTKPIQVKMDLREHTEYRWVLPQEAYERKDLINNFHYLLEKVYSVKT